MLELNSIVIDQTVAQEGRWFSYKDGAKLLIASTSGKAYRAALIRLAKSRDADLEDDSAEAIELSIDLTAELLAEKILLDWKGVTSGGKPVEYTSELGKKVLLSSPDLRSFVEEKSGQSSLFTVEEIEKAKK